jgi:hypothetical protein
LKDSRTDEDDPHPKDFRPDEYGQKTTDLGKIEELHRTKKSVHRRKSHFPPNIYYHK